MILTLRKTSRPQGMRIANRNRSACRGATRPNGLTRFTAGYSKNRLQQVVMKASRVAERDAPVDDRRDRADVLDLILRHGQVVAIEDDEVGELAGLDGSEILFLKYQIGVLATVGDER